MGCKQSAMMGSSGAVDMSANNDLVLYRVSDAVARQFHAEYVLGAQLGRGAFATVYEVQKAGVLEKHHRWAVKVMDLRMDRRGRPMSASEVVDQKRRVNVEKEVELLRIVRPLRHCVTLIDCFIEGCFSYVLMEKCTCTLLHALETTPVLNESSLRALFREMYEALAEIHRVQVIHRDVKPDNFLCWDGSPCVKLCDFGLASIAPPNNGLLSGVYGTPPFMAPEMLSSKGYNAKMDVWSLGVIAYVLLLGQFPYKPVEQNGKAMKAAIKAGVPAPSFRPKSTTGKEAITISADGVQFLRDVLNRAPEARPSAEAALNMRWLEKTDSQVEAKESANQPSLRPMLYSARRIGAFDPPPKKPKGDDGKSGLDLLMEELQEAHHHKPVERNASNKQSHTPHSARSTDMGTSAGASSLADRSVVSLMDFQAPGSLV